jgi:hypothetical protein
MNTEAVKILLEQLKQMNRSLEGIEYQLEQLRIGNKRLD